MAGRASVTYKNHSITGIAATPRPAGSDPRKSQPRAAPGGVLGGDGAAKVGDLQGGRRSPPTLTAHGKAMTLFLRKICACLPQQNQRYFGNGVTALPCHPIERITTRVD